MGHRSTFTSDYEYATATLEGREQPDHKRITAPEYRSCDIRRRPTGFIDYDFYREVAKRERERAKIAFVGKLLGMIATLSRPTGTAYEFAETINKKTRIGLSA